MNHTSSLFSKWFSVTPLALFPEHNIWKEWEFSKSLRAGSFCLTVHCTIYLANRKEKRGHIFHICLKISVKYPSSLITNSTFYPVVKHYIYAKFSATLYNQVACCLVSTMFLIFARNFCACFFLFLLHCFSMLSFSKVHL